MDIRYALRILLGRLTFPFLWLGIMVFNISGIVVTVLLPTPSLGHIRFHDFLHQILATRIGQLLWLSIPLMFLFRSLLDIRSFAYEYTHFRRTQSRLVLKISALQKQLGLPQEAEAPQIALNPIYQDVEHNQEEIDGSSYSQGTRVRHPKYGEGIVLRCEGPGENEKVTVQFGAHGIKKLVAKFSQLQKF